MIHTTMTIHCDTPDCESRYVRNTHDPDDLIDAARRAGWTVSPYGIGDRCPAC